MLYIPKRTPELEYCYVAVQHVVSMYWLGTSVFIELTNKRTLRIDYADAEATKSAMYHFNDAMTRLCSKEEAEKCFPKPTGGAIIRMA